MKYIIDDYCTITDMAKILKVNKHTLLHYENENIITPIYRGENGYRYYSGEQLAKFKTVLYLRELGFSIKEIKEYLLELDYSGTIKQMEEKLKKNRLEIEKLLVNEEKILACISSLNFLKKLENQQERPFTTTLEGFSGSCLPQTSFSLEETVINMKKIDDILNDVTWTEKYSFGFIIPLKNLNVSNFAPENFFISKKIESFTEYNSITSEYAILYTSKKEEYSISIKRLLAWIKNNNLIISSDLIIEDPSTYTISEKYNSYFKIFRVAVKKS